MFVLYVIITSIVITVIKCQRKDFCYGPEHLPCTSHTLSCKDGYIISVQSALYYRNTGCPVGGDICSVEEKCCKYNASTTQGHGDQLEEVLLDSIYQNCSAQQSCIINLPYNRSYKYSWVFYRYRCIEVASSSNLMCRDSVESTGSVNIFYFGKERKDTIKVNCMCNITVESGNITAFIRYINLNSESCSSFASTLSALQLGNCTDQGFHKRADVSSRVFSQQITLHISKLASSHNDIFWLTVSSISVGKVIKSTCSGCGDEVSDVCGRTRKELNKCYGGSTCSNHIISCPTGQLVAMTTNVHRARKYKATSCITSHCNDEQTCCTPDNTDILEVLVNKEMEKLFTTCNYKQSCIFSPDLTNSGNFNYIRYHYECIPESQTVDVTMPSPVKEYNELFLYYNGSTRSPNTRIVCSCTVISSSPTVTVTIYHMKLHPDSCCQFTMKAEGFSLPASCSAEGVTTLYTPSQIISSPVSVSLNNMVSRSDDIILIRFSSGSGVSAACDECTRESEDVTDDTETTIDQTNGDKIVLSGVIGGIIGGVFICIVVLIVCIIIRNRKTKSTLPSSIREQQEAECVNTVATVNPVTVNPVYQDSEYVNTVATVNPETVNPAYEDSEYDASVNGRHEHIYDSTNKPEHIYTELKPTSTCNVV